MSKRLLIGSASALIACVMLWKWFEHDHASSQPGLKQDMLVASITATEREAGSEPAAQAKEKDTPATVATPLPHHEELAPATAPQPKDLTSAKEAPNPLDKYLTGRNRDARSLLQAFRTSKNKDYLTEALKRYPDDPLVLFHSVLCDTDPTAERKAALRKLQELLPDDAVPCYLLGEQLLREGDADGALTLLMAGSLKPHAKNYANEMISDHRELLESSGVPPADALAQAVFDVEMRLLGPMRRLLSLVQDIHSDISAKNQNESAKKWAIAGSRIAQSMQGQMGQTLVEQLSGISSEKKFLALLAPDTELVAGGMTVAQRVKEIEAFRALASSFQLMADAALTLPPQEKQFFFKKVQQEGEVSALLWLNGRDQKQPVGTPTH